jgi:hypothetical protein
MALLKTIQSLNITLNGALHSDAESQERESQLRIDERILNLAKTKPLWTTCTKDELEAIKQARTETSNSH